MAAQLGQYHATAWPGHAYELRHLALGLLDKAQERHRETQIERGVGERQRRDVALDQSGRGCLPARLSKHLRVTVDAGDQRPARRQPAGIDARATAGIQRALAGPYGGKGHDRARLSSVHRPPQRRGEPGVVTGGGARATVPDCQNISPTSGRRSRPQFKCGRRSSPLCTRSSCQCRSVWVGRRGDHRCKLAEHVCEPPRAGPKGGSLIRWPLSARRGRYPR